MNHHSIIVLYLGRISSTKVCPEVKAIRKTIETETNQSVVKIFDVNNTGKYLINNYKFSRLNLIIPYFQTE